MKLLRTGAFVRAARHAKLAPLRTASQYRTPIAHNRPNQTYRNYASSPAAFPEQSVDDEHEVDPHKTAHISKEKVDESGDAKNKFAQKLKTGPEGVITSSEGGRLSGVKILGQPFVFDKTSNLSNSILNCVGRNLYDTPNHPIAITRNLIESHFNYPTYKNHIASNPVVTTVDNFDRLQFPQDHPGRSRTDTYYVDSGHVLRTHTSAHQHAAFKYMNENPEVGYTICADVYRRDSIDRSHFPVFHQMEGARMWQLEKDPKQKYETRLEQQNRRTQLIADGLESLHKHDLEIIDEAGHYNDKTNPVQKVHDKEETELIVKHLKRNLELLVAKVFRAASAANLTPEESKEEKLKVRWIEAYFPFTSPSFELEVFWQGEWLELLGSGVVRQHILNDAGLNDRVGWAWGIGIERLAMLLFNIPDIRLFWSQDSRFLDQFKGGKVARFKPFSKHPASYRDVSFWIQPSPAGASPIGAEPSASVAAAAGGDATKASPTETQPAAFHENDIMEIVRDIAGSMVEDVQLTEEFVHPRTGKKSLLYRINYRSLERTLTNTEVNEMHEKVLERIKDLPVEIR